MVYVAKLRSMLRFTALLTVSFCANSFAFENQVCQQNVTISAAANWVPYSYFESGGYKGLDIDILREVLDDLDFCYEFVDFPSSSRAFEQFKKNQVDLIFAASYTPERASYAAFSEPYRDETMVLLLITPTRNLG